MRHKCLGLLLAFLLSACSFQVDVLEPQSSEATLQSSPSPVTNATATPAVAAPMITATLLSTPTEIPSPLPPIITNPSNGSSIVPITFAPNATSQSVIGNLDPGASQIYSLNAFEGQIMSVSILPETPEQQYNFQLQIMGRDGAILCPSKDNACPFWRGVLPSTQEYLVKVTARDRGEFSMRVAINPPGTASQLFNYADSEQRFALNYPDDFAPAYFTGAQVTKIPPDFSLQYIDTQVFTSTNLNEVYFLVGVSNDPQQVSTCTEPVSFGGPETILGDTTINGVDFTKSEGGGVATGNIYEQVYYRTLHNGACYEVTYFIHYGNIGNYPPGAVNEFDRNALYEQLDKILASLILTG